MFSRAMQSLYLPRDKAVVAALVAIVGCIACGLATPPERLLAGCFLSIMLAWAALVDIDRMILPDLLTLPLLMTGLANAAWAPAAGPLNAFIGTAVGYFAFIGLSHLFSRILGRPALGKGDAKLMAAAGAWLGWEWLPYVSLIASSSALLIVLAMALASSKPLTIGRIAFGPYLVLALGVCWLAANPVTHARTANDFAGKLRIDFEYAIHGFPQFGS
jgi:leader peptidase (prepilin peptidase)/N-methyltransferase